LAIDEFKTHLRQRPVLRSQTPAGVVQEVYGLLLGHYVVRKLLCEAAATTGLGPRQLSFNGALKILRCRLPEVPPGGRGLQRWYADLVAEVAEEVLEPRRDRVNPRVIKRAKSTWKKSGPTIATIPSPPRISAEALSCSVERYWARTSKITGPVLFFSERSKHHGDTCGTRSCSHE
jgi:hypothetical protein